MILKAEILLDATEGIDAQVIAVLLEQVFKDNSHLAKMIVCEVKEPIKPKEHQWEFYVNGSFCKICGSQLGSGQPCR